MEGPAVVNSNHGTRSRNTRWQPTRRATARVLPGAPRAAADAFCWHRLGGQEAIALGVAWVSCRRHKAPRGQQRRGYSDGNSERSRHLIGARVVSEAKRDEKVSLRRP